MWKQKDILRGLQEQTGVFEYKETLQKNWTTRWTYSYRSIANAKEKKLSHTNVNFMFDNFPEFTKIFIW